MLWCDTCVQVIVKGQKLCYFYEQLKRSQCISIDKFATKHTYAALFTIQKEVHTEKKVLIELQMYKKIHISK